MGKIWEHKKYQKETSDSLSLSHDIFKDFQSVRQHTEMTDIVHRIKIKNSASQKKSMDEFKTCLIFKYSHILRYQEIGLQHTNCEGRQFNPQHKEKANLPNI